MEVRLMEDKVRIMKTNIDNAEYFRMVCGGYGGPTEEELEVEKAKLEGLYEKRYDAYKKEQQEKRAKGRKPLETKRQKGEPYDKYTAMCNGVPVW